MDEHDHDHECDVEEFNPRTPRIDPAKVARSVELTDEESAMSVAEIEHYAREVELAQLTLRAAMGRYVVATQEFRSKLLRKYPQIDPPSAMDSTHARWNGKLYFVCWDDERPS